MSYSLGAVSHSAGLFQVEGSGAIYQEALQDLWKNVEAAYGKTTGESVALANVRDDADMMNLFFYTKLKVTVRADLIKFTK